MSYVGLLGKSQTLEAAFDDAIHKSMFTLCYRMHLWRKIPESRYRSFSKYHIHVLVTGKQTDG